MPAARRVEMFSCSPLLSLFVCLCLFAGGRGVTAVSSRFNCTTDYPAPPRPKNNVSKLHPAHVDYVMALGDSITAAFAARSNLDEARDISWSIGVGTNDQLTLPRLMSFYQGGNVPKGASTKAVIPKNPFHLPHGDYHPGTDNLNVAESQGSVHRNSMVEEWAILSDQVGKLGPDFEDGWKVLTVWMTANDVCGKCDKTVSSKYLDEWSDAHDALIQNVTSTMKNVYISLTSTLDLSNVARIQRSVPWCSFEHRVILQECGCIDRGDAKQLAQFSASVRHPLMVLDGR